MVTKGKIKTVRTKKAKFFIFSSSVLLLATGAGGWVRQTKLPQEGATVWYYNNSGGVLRIETTDV